MISHDKYIDSCLILLWGVSRTYMRCVYLDGWVGMGLELGVSLLGLGVGVGIKMSEHALEGDC